MIDRPAWPVIAAALSALLGMGSCALTAVPFTLIFAPIVALLLSPLLFRLLLPLGTAAPTVEQHDRWIGRAAAVAWLITIGVTWALSSWADTQLVLAGMSPGSGARELGVLGGIVVGGILASQVRSIGARYWTRVHPATSTIHARDEP